MGISIGQGLLAGSEGVAGGFIEGRKNIARDLEAKALASQNTIENALAKDKETRLGKKSLLDLAQQEFDNKITSEKLKVDQARQKLSEDEWNHGLKLEAKDNFYMDMVNDPEARSIGSDINAEIAKPKSNIIPASSARLPSSGKPKAKPAIEDTMEETVDGLITEAEGLDGVVNSLSAEFQRGAQILEEGNVSQSKQTQYRVKMNNEIRLAQNRADKALERAEIASKVTARRLQSKKVRNDLRDYENTKSAGGEMINGVLEDVDGILDSLADGEINIFGEAQGSWLGQKADKYLGFIETALGVDIISGIGMETKTMRGQFTRVQGEQILNKIKTAKFGQLSEGEREFIKNIVINQDDTVESVILQLKRIKRVLTLGKDRFNFIESIDDPKVRKQVNEDILKINNASDFNDYKRQYVIDNPDSRDFTPKTVSKEPDAINTSGWSGAQYDELEIGTRFIANGVEGIIQ